MNTQKPSFCGLEHAGEQKKHGSVQHGMNERKLLQLLLAQLLHLKLCRFVVNTQWVTSHFDLAFAEPFAKLKLV